MAFEKSIEVIINRLQKFEDVQDMKWQQSLQILEGQISFCCHQCLPGECCVVDCKNNTP